MDGLTQAKVVASAVQPFIDAAVKVALAEYETRRAETEMRLLTRLKELAEKLKHLEQTRLLEVDDRTLQHQHLSQLIDIAKETGNPLLIVEAMKCFRAYVEKTPSFTRDFVMAMEAAEPRARHSAGFGLPRVVIHRQRQVSGGRWAGRHQQTDLGKGGGLAPPGQERAFDSAIFGHCNLRFEQGIGLAQENGTEPRI
jgi:hypothetical protein